MEQIPNSCEECEWFFRLAQGCEKAQYFVLRKKDEDRPKWCPLEEEGENDEQVHGKSND